MGNMPTPRADALRAMREAKYEHHQKLMKQSKATTIGDLRAAAAEASKKTGKSRKAKKKRKA